MNDDDRTLLDTLVPLELELQRPATRGDRARLEALLSDDLVEVGFSGARYSRNDLLERLPAQAVHAEVHADEFALRVLAPDVALLTYRSAHVLADGALERHSLRASLWQRGEGGWRLSYHQGTPAQAVWARG